MSSLLEQKLAVVAHSSLYVNLKLFVISAKHTIVPKISDDFSANIDEVHCKALHLYTGMFGPGLHFFS